ncbi:MAG: type I glyceraldehyde-3-phosphate dehydrogenase [Bacilli bacterium]
MKKIAINGFGRIGRLTFRQMFEDSDFEIVAINDLTDSKTLAHLLKYDSAQKKYEKEISFDEDGIIVENKKIKVYSQKDPKNLPWESLNIDVVMECTGFFTDKEKAQAHITAGAKKVIISAPAKGDLKTIVFNVNHTDLDGSETIISAASCTTNCLAPMTKVLHDACIIKNGFITTIHAYTGDQNLLDGPHRKGNLRRARAAAVNIVPSSTGAAKAIGLVIPELEGVLDGNAQRVPIVTGSLTELTAIVDKKVTVEEINKIMKNASNESFGYNEDEIVSCDIIGTKYASLFDATLTKVQDLGNQTLVKVTSWYDNEASYTAQMVRTAEYLCNNL